MSEPHQIVNVPPEEAAEYWNRRNAMKAGKCVVWAVHCPVCETHYEDANDARPRICGLCGGELSPLPDETADPTPRPIPQVVLDSLRKSYPNECHSILRTLHWSSLNGCFYFERWGLYVGVEEKDGYIHT